MRRIVPTIEFSAILSCLSLASLACGGQPAASEPGAELANRAAQHTAYEPPPSPLRVFPGDTTFVVGFDLEAIATSDYFPLVSSILSRQFADVVPQFERVESICGITIADVGKVVAGGKLDENMNLRTETTIIITQGLARTRLVDCVRTLRQEEGAIVEESGAFTTITGPDESQWFAWLDDHTMVLTSEMERAEIEKRLTSHEGLDTNQRMMTHLDAIDRTRAIWVLMAPEDGIETSVSLPDIHFAAAYGSMALSENMDIEMGIHTGGHDQARELKRQLDEQIPQLAPMLGPLRASAEKIQFSAEDITLVARLSLTRSEVETIVATIRALVSASE